MGAPTNPRCGGFPTGRSQNYVAKQASLICSDFAEELGSNTHRWRCIFPNSMPTSATRYPMQQHTTSRQQDVKHPIS